MSGKLSDWREVRLGDILRYSDDRVVLEDEREYLTITVKRRNGGLELRDKLFGHQIATKKQFKLVPGAFIISRVQCWHQAYAIVGDVAPNAIASSNYDQFLISPDVDPRFFWWLSHSPAFTETVRSSAVGVVIEKMVFNRDQWLTKTVLLPPLAEQRRIVSLIDELAAQIDEATSLREAIARDSAALLSAAFHRIANDAPKRPLGELTPLNRRPAVVELDKNYPQVSVRSFGRGTFHKPPLIGEEITWEKPFLVRAGDILVSNIKAWEGALAVAEKQDDSRFGSHRYLTFVPIEGVATARFVCFYLLTSEGLFEVGEASPGSADRNRTLSAKSFLKIGVPTPDYTKQVWFDSLCVQMDALKQTQLETAVELEALLPSILDRAFKGEL